MNLLLHMCCGPCSCYPVKKLRQEGIEPVGYFFNPNIHPYKEWDMRLKTAREFAAKVDMSLQLGLYRQQYCGCVFSERDRYEIVKRPKGEPPKGEFVVVSKHIKMVNCAK